MSPETAAFSCVEMNATLEAPTPVSRMTETSTRYIVNGTRQSDDAELPGVQPIVVLVCVKDTSIVVTVVK